MPSQTAAGLTRLLSSWLLPSTASRGAVWIAHTCPQTGACPIFIAKATVLCLLPAAAAFRFICSIGNLRDSRNFQLTWPRAPSWVGQTGFCLLCVCVCGGGMTLSDCLLCHSHIPKLGRVTLCLNILKQGFKTTKAAFFPFWASPMKTAAITEASWTRRVAIPAFPVYTRVTAASPYLPLATVPLHLWRVPKLFSGELSTMQR